MDFNTVAENWDNSMRIERSKKISEEIRANIETLNLRTALEFGCGTGLISFNLVDLFEEIDLIDTSSKMIEIVNEKARILEKNNVRGFCKNLLEESHNKKYDCIFTSMALHHVKDIEKIFNKFYDLLENDGILCIVDLDEDVDGKFHSNEEGFDGHDGFDHDLLITTAEKCRLKTEKIYTFYVGTKEIDENVVSYSLFIDILRKK